MPVAYTHLEAVNMYGSELGLLIPAKILPGGKSEFWYNYFEDAAWEPAGFDASDCDFWTNKIGSQEFNDVVTAANFLYEVHDDGNPGFVEINGEIVKMCIRDSSMPLFVSEMTARRRLPWIPVCITLSELNWIRCGRSGQKMPHIGNSVDIQE